MTVLRDPVCSLLVLIALWLHNGRMRRRYRSIPDLAERLEIVARAQRNALLSPETAAVVVAALRAFAVHPDREQVIKAVCRYQGRCESGCFSCMGIANAIMAMYRGEEPMGRIDFPRRK